jgi:hypothetical protein
MRKIHLSRIWALEGIDVAVAGRYDGRRSDSWIERVPVVCMSGGPQMKCLVFVFVACALVISCSGDGTSEAGNGEKGGEATTVTVNGEVESPATFEWAEGMTLSEAIARAGGPTEKADAESVNLVRMKHVTIHDLARIKSGEETDTPLMRGDVISVPAKLER